MMGGCDGKRWIVGGYDNGGSDGGYDGESVDGVMVGKV